MHARNVKKKRRGRNAKKRARGTGEEREEGRPYPSATLLSHSFGASRREKVNTNVEKQIRALWNPPASNFRPGELLKGSAGGKKTRASGWRRKGERKGEEKIVYVPARLARATERKNS